MTLLGTFCAHCNAPREVHEKGPAFNARRELFIAADLDPTVPKLPGFEYTPATCPGFRAKDTSLQAREQYRDLLASTSYSTPEIKH